MNKSEFICVVIGLCLFAIPSRAQPENVDVIWAKAISGSEEFSLERGLSTATDTNGNIFAAGLYAGALDFGSVVLPQVEDSHYLAKYTDGGQFLWAQLILTDRLVGVATDAAGNCYVAGEFSNDAWVGSTNLTAASSATFVAAFNAAGDFLWARTVNVSECYRIAANDSGHVTIAGMLQGVAQFGSITLSNFAYGMYVSRLNPQGTFQWAARGSGTYVYLADLAVDPAGNAYLGGSFWGNSIFGNTNVTSAGGSDMFVTKFNSSGGFVWVRRFGGTLDRGSGSPSDQVSGLAVDGAGNISFAGFFGGNWTFGPTNLSGQFPSMLVGRLNTNGNPVWGRSAHGFYGVDPIDLGLDRFGHVYVVGNFSSEITLDTGFSLSGNFDNVFLAKFSNGGQFLGAHAALSSSSLIPAALAVDIFGGVSVIGECNQSADFAEHHIDTVGDSTFLYKSALIGSAAPPVITQNPKDRRIVNNGGTNLTVVVSSGASPINYQWQSNGVNIAGATAVSYAITAMNASKAGPYRVRVSTSAGAITSAVANVSLAFAPTISTHPITQTLIPGSNIVFSVAADGTAPLTYRWLRDGLPVPGGTGPVLSLNNLHPAHAGAYHVVVSNEWGIANSYIARLDQVPHLHFGSPTYVAAENGGTITIPVMRSYRTSGQVTVSFTTSSGNAFASEDYTEVFGNLTWPDGDSADRFIQIPITNDSEVEDNETFMLNLFAPTADAAIGSPGEATVVILDNDSPGRISCEQPAITVSEAAGQAEVRVVRTGAAGQTLSVHFSTINGTALSGNDYAARSGLLSFAGNDAAKSIFVPITDDWPIEGSENFSVRLDSPTAGATIVNSNTLVTIEDSAHSMADRFGYGLLIAAFRTNSFDRFGSFIDAVVTVTNGGAINSGSGLLQLDGTAPFASEPTNYPFAAIPAHSAREIPITAVGEYIFGGTSSIHAMVFEQAAPGLVLQDRREIFQIFGTAPPTGGVPLGCCIATGNPVPNLPFVTNVIITGADALNEGASAQYTARVVLSNGQTNDSPAVTWGASAFTISGNGQLTTPQISSNTTVFVRVTNTFNGLTLVATKAVTVRDLRARLAGPRPLTGNRHRVTLTGPANRVYQMQETTHLPLWTNVGRVTNITGTLLWTNAATAAPRRFYRAMER